MGQSDRLSQIYCRYQQTRCIVVELNMSNLLKPSNTNFIMEKAGCTAVPLLHQPYLAHFS